jgi:hypothetical protein
MRLMFRNFAPLIVAAAIASSAFATGCAVHARVYGPGEDVYYTQWEHETHREHLDYDRRNDRDQKEYWKWRHDHPNQ